MIILTTYPPQISFSDICINVVFWLVVVLLYKSRNKTPQNKKMWTVVQTFLIVLVATLGVNYAKKSIKDWWNK